MMALACGFAFALASLCPLSLDGFDFVLCLWMPFHWTGLGFWPHQCWIFFNKKRENV